MLIDGKQTNVSINTALALCDILWPDGNYAIHSEPARRPYRGSSVPLRYWMVDGAPRESLRELCQRLTNIISKVYGEPVTVRMYNHGKSIHSLPNDS